MNKKYNFDEIIDRRGTDSVKWQFYESDGKMVEYEEGGPGEEILPLWVADMDFRSPPAVVDALVERARHGLFGYTGQSRDYNRAVVDWMAARRGWAVDPEWITVSPGVVPALFNLVQALTEPGDKVLIQPPVYHPFTFAVEKNDRVPARVPLRLEDGRYRMDFDGLADTLADPDVRLTILCSPHNPVGRVWTAGELQRFGRLCLKNSVIVISDEVFADLVYPGVEFTTFAALGEAHAQNAAICTSPSKAFNLPGLKTSNIIIPNETIRKTFRAQLDRNAVYGMNAFGNTAVKAAYRHGGAWLAQVMDYIRENYLYLRDYLADHLPEAVVIEPEGTYLVWVDFRPLGVEKGFCRERLIDEGQVYLDDGGIFGPEGERFARFNIACPRAVLEEALARVVDCLK